MQEIIKVGNIVGKGESQGGGTYLPEGISPTLIAGMYKGTTVPYIVEVKKIGRKKCRK